MYGQISEESKKKLSPKATPHQAQNYGNLYSTLLLINERLYWSFDMGRFVHKKITKIST